MKRCTEFFRQKTSYVAVKVIQSNILGMRILNLAFKIHVYFFFSIDRASNYNIFIEAKLSKVGRVLHILKRFG